jgi:hypothetical protein
LLAAAQSAEARRAHGQGVGRSRWNLVDAKRRGAALVRQITASQTAGILRPDRLVLATHPREEARVWIEPLARQLDEIVAIGDLYRFDRFTAPASLWDDLQQRHPGLLTTD